MFGSAQAGGETWEYASGQWTQRAVAAPPVHWAHGFVYDSVRHRMIAFGGYLNGAIDILRIHSLRQRVILAKVRERANFGVVRKRRDCADKRV